MTAVHDEQNTKRRLFHSFPRPRQGERQHETVARGLAILSFMKDAGMVLAPEVVGWDLTSLLAKPEKIEVHQRRACFTELSFEELQSHATSFGPISLAFDIGKLRACGATPVIYIPQGQTESLISHLGAFCVYGAYHTEHVLRQLQGLKEQSDPTHVERVHGRPVSRDYTINLRNTAPDGSVVAEYTVPAEHVRQVLAHVGFNNIPFDHSAAVLGVFLNMFYPTDNMHAGEQLGYYRQREWRLITSDIQFNRKPMSRDLSREERERLLSIDREFWNRNLLVGGVQTPRHTLAQVYAPDRHTQFFDLVDAIVVPRENLESVRTILGDTVNVLPLT